MFSTKHTAAPLLGQRLKLTGGGGGCCVITPGLGYPFGWGWW